MTEVKTAVKDTLESLVETAREGHKEALEGLIKSIQDRIYALAVRMLFNPSDAEDATQEILIKVVTNLRGFRFEGPFMAWAMRVAANHLKTIRRSRAEKRELNMEKSHEVMDRAEARGWFSRPLEAPAPLMEIEMRSACTQALLLSLDRPHRMAFVLGVVMDMSGREGADVMEISPAAFRKRLSRARGRVKNFLSTHCGLFDEANPCRCAAVFQGHAARGWVDPGKPVFVSPSSESEDPNVLREYLKELDDLGRVSALFKAFPRNAGATDFATRIRTMFENKKYRILSDPQISTPAECS